MTISQLRTWLLALIAVALVGCGGGSSENAGEPILGGTGGGGSGSVSSLQIKFSPTSVDNSGAQALVAKVTALDANGQGVAGVPLTLAVDNHATFAVTGTDGSVTASDGTVSADVTIGNDTSPRTITMTASGGGASSSASFDVVASKQVASDLILVASSSQVQNTLGNTVTVTATAMDANRNALPDIPITFSVDNGATITPAGTVTGNAGTLTGVVGIGSDQSARTITVTATSGTVVRKASISVIGTKLTASGISTRVSAGSTGNLITYLLVDNAGKKLADYPITVVASGLKDTSGRTNADGEFAYRYDAPTNPVPQTLTITASAGGTTDVQSIAVVASSTTPPAVTQTVNSASVSANPNVVSVNTPSAPTANKTEIRALFLSENNAPVQNVRVWFDLNGDQQSIGGTLGSTADRQLLYSDASGIARTTYAAGTRFSPKDGVTIRACWDLVEFAIPAEGAACAHQVLVTLTVISESLSVTIGTSNKIDDGPSGLTYIVRFVVQVVDSAGQAKVGVQVTPSIDLLTYYKGEWRPTTLSWVRGGKGNRYPHQYPKASAVPPEGFPNLALPTGAAVPVEAQFIGADTLTPSWAAGNVTVCDNEDLNRNGVVEQFIDKYQVGAPISEDQNNSYSLSTGRPALDPHKADVSITAENGVSTTDSNGIVILKIEYPQNVASWVLFNILVSASGIGGTEGRANFSEVLPVPATVVANIQADPPFRFSPYGIDGSDAYLHQSPQGQSGLLCTYKN